MRIGALPVGVGVLGAPVATAGAAPGAAIACSTLATGAAAVGIALAKPLAVATLGSALATAALGVAEPVALSTSGAATAAASVGVAKPITASTFTATTLAVGFDGRIAIDATTAGGAVAAVAIALDKPIAAATLASASAAGALATPRAIAAITAGSATAFAALGVAKPVSVATMGALTAAPSLTPLAGPPVPGVGARAARTRVRLLSAPSTRTRLRSAAQLRVRAVDASPSSGFVPVMSSRVYLKAGDTGRRLLLALEDQGGTPQDLTGVASVAFSMRRRGTVARTVSQRSCTVVDAAAGQVRVDWNPGDLDAPGTYEAEIVATWGAGANAQQVTFPAAAAPEDYLLVVVQPDV